METKTYTQNWPLYNLSQTKEKMMFLKILNDAVDYLNIPYEYQFGRPHIGLDDAIKCCCIKVFNNFSSRRTIGELHLAYALGYIRKIVHFNTINKYMNDSAITPYLHRLYKLLALPLVNIENNFAIDATGFSLPHKVKWKEIRLNGLWRHAKDYKKLHIINGVKTNIITSAKVSIGKHHDSPYFESLVKDTSINFRIKEISADTGYLSRRNCKIAEEVGAMPFILPKENTSSLAKGVSAWNKMIRLWYDNTELFAQHYHKRSNVESTFSMIKRKFLGYVRSKTDVAQTNELLCKIVCHNIAVLVNSIFELNIELSWS